MVGVVLWVCAWYNKKQIIGAETLVIYQTYYHGIMNSERYKTRCVEF